MSSSPTRSRGRPPRIDRERALRVALGMLDRSGLDALAMRRPADVMDVRAGTPYRHFTAKRDLRTARSEHMMGRVAEVAAMARGRAGSGVGSERSPPVPALCMPPCSPAAMVRTCSPAHTPRE
ncbi:TetR/AcrR family transcriptional regulator [Streptomyces hygroscopicus]|uniref:TetR/AcrR family transcriptional regulator n=1 Tax=Streptomyces hygroscopicus TaxID=1912 RepID=UPI0032D58A72